jgi:hypothetical protein
VLLDKPWAEATDRDYKIRGRHSKEYYKHADRFLRNEVEAYRLEGDDPQKAAEFRLLAQQARDQMRVTAAEIEA